MTQSTPIIPHKFFLNEYQKRWNERRLKFILDLFGSEWFKDKRVLEVACGCGFFGRELSKLGANVSFTDARQMHIDDLVHDGFVASVMDQDKPWTIEEPIDLVIHFGVLYHLDKWKQDLECAIKTSPLVLLESEVIDSLDPKYERKISEMEHYDQAFNITATRFSDTHVEAFLNELGAPFTRYDSTAIDVPEIFVYSWKHGDAKELNYFPNSHRRRMWLIGNKE